jgi:23S rRNA (cytosine1962-C5)-methyltransferase
MTGSELTDLLSAAFWARTGLLAESHQSAFRIFNGFYEGFPDLAVDIYARTLVLHNYAPDPNSAAESLITAQAFYLEKLTWLKCAIVKHRKAKDPFAQRGVQTYGQSPDIRIQEDGVWYALDLLLNQDTSLYLDTRDLRKWAKHNLQGARVLNTFAYTGSLGVAALAGGARRAIQLDRNKDFLQLAKTSYTLNGFPIRRADFLVSDFFTGIAGLKRSGQLFDCIFVDPPIFSVTSGGTVDMVNESYRIINKVRPLVAHNGLLVAINNALYFSGREYLQILDRLSEDGYLSVEKLLPVPLDFTGYPHTVRATPPIDPTPFNHPTKIAILRIRRKDGAISYNPISG